ncbi:nuclease [Malassezia caprae]|uniref:Endonuclease n=1 Tax=Malassezia caprae TaxID=1381934 RepID=A0AAF0E7A2_9BASI|nr:nuclease [Malassezia caprae]
MSLAVQAGLFAGGVVLGAGGAVWLQGSHKKAAMAPPSATPKAEMLSAPSLAATPSATPVNDALALSGHPGPVADFLRNQAYVSAYDRRLRHPVWTAEHLTAESIRRPPGTEVNRAQSIFAEDPRIPAAFRSTNSDYFRSGYDRGHMVPAADAKSSQAAMNETFYLSNIAPQVGPGMNRDYWAHTEDFVRRLTGQFKDLYVFTLPLYLPRQSTDGKWRVSYEVIGSPPSVSVPTHFAKVVLGAGQTGPGTMLGGSAKLALGAFIMPNSMIPDTAPLRSFEVDVEAVERAAGLTLFPPAIKQAAKKLCDTVKCEIIVRDFGDANKKLNAPTRSHSMP